jgi:hypothetical protein
VLRKLDLSHNDIGGGFGCACISEGLSHNSTLRILDLSWNSLKESGARSIATVIKSNVGLQELFLSSNRLREGGAREIADALAHNTALRVLNVSSNHIGEGGGRAFASALKCNMSLRSLDITWNTLSHGAEALGDALATNSTLENLDASYNCISVKGALAITGALRTNKVLRSLSIDESGSEGVLALGEALLDTPRPHRFSLKGCKLGKIVNSLGLSLPESASEWSNDEILERFRDMQMQKVVAFAMGQHHRLGAASALRHLNGDIMPMFFAELFGCGLGAMKE